MGGATFSAYFVGLVRLSEMWVHDRYVQQSDKTEINDF